MQSHVTPWISLIWSLNQIQITHRKAETHVTCVSVYSKMPRKNKYLTLIVLFVMIFSMQNRMLVETQWFFVLIFFFSVRICRTFIFPVYFFSKKFKTGHTNFMCVFLLKGQKTGTGLKYFAGTSFVKWEQLDQVISEVLLCSKIPWSCSWKKMQFLESVSKVNLICGDLHDL